MPAGILHLTLDPSTNKLQIIEDGQIDLRVLGPILSRQRVGSINPCPTNLSQLEVTMTIPNIPLYKLSHLYTLKEDAIKAEVEEVLSAQEQDRSKGRKGKENGERRPSCPLTGSTEARCPCCRHVLHSEVEVLAARDHLGNKTHLVYKCACTTTTDTPS